MCWRRIVLNCHGCTSNLALTVLPKASLHAMVCGRLGAWSLPSVCSAWLYEPQLLAGPGRHRIVHNSRGSDSGQVDWGEGARGRT